MKKTAKVTAVIALSLAIAGGAAAATVGLRGYIADSPAAATALDAAAIKQGSRGDTVKKIQRKLKNWGYYGGSVDGIFGAATKKAVV